MKLTGTEINKAYSEQLAKLLLDGYRLVVARENGSLEENKNSYSRILLEKGGKRFEFGFWYAEINSNTEKQILGLMKCGRFSSNYRYEKEENILVESFTCYNYVFELGSEHQLYKYFTFSTEEEALELYEKRKKRAEYREWKNQHIINTFKVKNTNYKGFKKDVTIESLPYSYILINKNGRKATLSKSTGRLTVY